MSDEQRPPGSPKGDGPVTPAGIPAGGAGAGDTPRDGVPAFDDIDIEFAKDSVPPVGPSPDHASEYVPPRPLPKPVDHRTIENVPVALSPDIDPRRMRTQKAMHVIKREEAVKALVEMGIAPPTTSVVEVPPESNRSSKSLVVIVVLLVLAAAGGYAAYTYMQKSASAPTDPSAGVVAIPNAPLDPPAIPTPAPSPTNAAAEPAELAPTPAGLAPTPAVSESPEPTLEPMPPSALPTAAPNEADRRTRNPSKDAPRPINE